MFSLSVFINKPTHLGDVVSAQPETDHDEYRKQEIYQCQMHEKRSDKSNKLSAFLSGSMHTINQFSSLLICGEMLEKGGEVSHIIHQMSAFNRLPSEVINLECISYSRCLGKSLNTVNSCLFSVP